MLSTFLFLQRESAANNSTRREEYRACTGLPDPRLVTKFATSTSAIIYHFRTAFAGVFGNKPYNVTSLT